MVATVTAGSRLGPRIVVIYWRDIPAQVNAQSGRLREKVVLPGRFQEAIDKATVTAELFIYHEFVKQWRRTDQTCGPDLASEASLEADRIAMLYPPDRLSTIVANLGYEP